MIKIVIQAHALKTSKGSWYWVEQRRDGKWIYHRVQEGKHFFVVGVSDGKSRENTVRATDLREPSQFKNRLIFFSNNPNETDLMANGVARIKDPVIEWISFN